MSTDPRRSFAGCRISETCTTPMCVLPGSATPHTPSGLGISTDVPTATRLRRRDMAVVTTWARVQEGNSITATPRRVARGTDPPETKCPQPVPDCLAPATNSGSHPATPGLLSCVIVYSNVPRKVPSPLVALYFVSFALRLFSTWLLGYLSDVDGAAQQHLYQLSRAASTYLCVAEMAVVWLQSCCLREAISNRKIIVKKKGQGWWTTCIPRSHTHPVKSLAGYEAARANQQAVYVGFVVIWGGGNIARNTGGVTRSKRNKPRDLEGPLGNEITHDRRCLPATRASPR